MLFIYFCNKTGICSALVAKGNKGASSVIRERQGHTWRACWLEEVSVERERKRERERERLCCADWGEKVSGLLGGTRRWRRLRLFRSVGQVFELELWTMAPCWTVRHVIIRLVKFIIFRIENLFNQITQIDPNYHPNYLLETSNIVYRHFFFLINVFISFLFANYSKSNSKSLLHATNFFSLFSLPSPPPTYCFRLIMYVIFSIVMFNAISLIHLPILDP